MMKSKSFVVAAVIAMAGWTATAFAQDVERGVELYRAFKFAEAEQVLVEAAQADRENVRALEFLGLSQLGLGKTREAEETLNKAHDLAPESDSVKVAQARVSIEAQQLERAESLLGDAASINKDNPEIALYMGAIKLAQRNYQGAVNDLNTALSMKTTNPYAHYYAGLAWNGLKKPDRMVDNFQAFLRLAPDAPEAARVRSLLRAVR
jgi:tetratricopeptide (TPR) repeat protein